MEGREKARVETISAGLMLSVRQDRRLAFGPELPQPLGQRVEGRRTDDRLR